MSINRTPLFVSCQTNFSPTSSATRIRNFSQLKSPEYALGKHDWLLFSRAPWTSTRVRRESPPIAKLQNGTQSRSWLAWNETNHATERNFEKSNGPCRRAVTCHDPCSQSNTHDPVEVKWWLQNSLTLAANRAIFRGWSGESLNFITSMEKKKTICKIMGENPRSPIRKGHKMSDCSKRFLIGNEKQNESDKRHNKANSCYWALTQLRFWCDLIVQKSRWCFYHHHKKQMCRSFDEPIECQRFCWVAEYKTKWT